MRVLYITYDGLTDPLGQSQVLPYLAGLNARGHDITILSCEKPDRMEAGSQRIGDLCAAADLKWTPLTYHKRPPILSSIWDQAMLIRAALRLHSSTRFDLVHCRSYIPASVGLHLRRRRGVRFLFDMRGFWADERVDGGLWDLSNPAFRAVYGHFKRREAEFLAEADHIVSLTEEGKRVLLARPDHRPDGPPISVIPCCVDMTHFALPSPGDRADARQQLGIAPGRKVVVYLGSVGTWYMLPEMLDFFRVYLAHYPDALLFFVTQDDPEPIRSTARSRGVNPDHLLIRPASRAQVPHFVAAGDFGLFFIKPVFSKKASSPTKMGELLALGLPVVANGDVGDVDEIAAATGAGVTVNGFSEADYYETIGRLEKIALPPPDIRQAAVPWFDAEMGVNRYDRIYRSFELAAADRKI